MKASKKGNVVTIKLSITNADWEQWILFRSDAHHDCIFCKRELEKEQLDLAVERNAIILDGGDLFDAMQGKFDPRRDLSHIRPEYIQNNPGVRYYDSLVEEAYEFYKPYVKNFVMLGKGNHETAVMKNADTDLTERIVALLNANGGQVFSGGYGGWVRFMFDYSGWKSSIALKYFHGSGGGSPVTRGTIQTNRQSVFTPDADIVWNGHSHDAFILPIARERLNKNGNIVRDLQWHIRTPGYADKYNDGSNGWWIEKGLGPRPLGCIWLRLGYNSTEKRLVKDFISDMR